MSVLNITRYSFLLSIASILFVVPLGSAVAQDNVIVVDSDISGNPLRPSDAELNASQNSLQNDIKNEQNGSVSNQKNAVDEVMKTFNTSSSGEVISAPSVINSDENNEEEDLFFDAGDIVPQGEMARSAPVKVDPVTQPGSKYIIVKKNYKADTKTARLVSAQRAMSLGRYESALLMFDDLYEINKRDTRVVLGRAVALQKLGRFDEAMQMYEVLSKLDPKNVDVKVNMLGLLGTRYPSIALRRLLDLQKDNKSNVSLAAQIAILYANIGDFSSALSYLGMAASMEPNNANHIFNMAVIYEKVNDNEKAVSYYEKALELDTIYGAGRSIPRDVAYERLAQIR